MLREAGLDGSLELDDPMPQRLGNLVRHEALVEEVELTPDEAVPAVCDLAASTSR